jgi:hypothetical protein
MEKYRVYVAGEKEVKEIAKEEVVEELRRTFWDIGGFRLNLYERVLDYVLLTHGRRLGGKPDYILDEWIYTDGELELVAKKNVYDLLSRDDTTYKYRVKNANFVIKVHLYGDDFDGKFIYSGRQVEIYGNCPLRWEIEKKNSIHKW